MIKFFRKIRQKLLSENKFSKYLIYAIGEIILVVIGILIALSINNSNEQSKARKQEINYLKKLQADILLELKNNENMIVFRDNKAKASMKLLDFKVIDNESNFVELEETIFQVFFWETFIPTNNTYKELLSSGNLNFIKNDSIKDHLLELDKKYVYIDNVEHHIRREFEQYLYDVSITNADILNTFDFLKTAEEGEYIFKKPSQIPINNFIPKYKKLFSDISFKNGLKLSIINNIALKNYHTELTKHLEKLNDLITEDLKDN